MPAKKKTAASIEAAPAAKRAPRATSAAATHKAPARKKAAAFDSAAHHDEIAREAYALWQARGCAHGAAHEDWMSAVEIVRRRCAAA